MQNCSCIDYVNIMANILHNYYKNINKWYILYWIFVKIM
jgi:hypothetical protein